MEGCVNMSKRVRIDSISAEAMEYLKNKYNISQEQMQKIIGSEVKVADEVVEMLEETKKYGAVGFEVVEERENEEPEVEEGLEEEETTEEIDEKEEAEKEPEEIEEESEEMTPERKQYEIKYLRTRAMAMLEQIEAYRDLPSDLQYKVISTYDKVADVGDIRDENFLKKHLTIEDGTYVGTISQIHMMVLGGLKMQDHIRENQEVAEVQIEQEEIDAQSASEANAIGVRLPKIIDDMDPYLKADAEESLAEQIKKYLELATTNRSPEQALLIISDVKKYAEEVKKDYATSIDSGDEKEAVRTYVAQMPITEMAGVMAAVKDVTGDVKISFDDIDWNNEVERNVAISLLAQTQNATETLGISEPVIDKLEIKFDVNNWQDIQEMTKACKDLGVVAQKQGVEVSAQLNVSDSLSEEEREELEETAEQVLVANGIEVEGEEQDTLGEVTETLVEAEIAAVSLEADVLPEEMSRMLDELGRTISQEIAGPGMITSSN